MKKYPLSKVLYTGIGLASLAMGPAWADPAGNPFPAAQYPAGYPASYPANAPHSYVADRYPSDIWSGPYIGVHGGYEFGDFNNDGNVAGPTGSHSSWMGGGQLGGNWQFTHHVVLGVEGDASAMDITEHNPSSTFGEDWMATFRGRAGYAIDRTMPYITAGVGLTDTYAHVSSQGSASDVQAGAAVGGGVDFKLSDMGQSNAMSHWAGRVEYLYVDVPKDNVTVGNTPVTGGSGNNIVRVGLNYMF